MINDFSVKLSSADRNILKSYSILCDSLALYLGSSYEIVLHSLHDLDHSAIRVINGFHTNRTEGAPITNLALTALKEIKNAGKDYIPTPYFTTNGNGDPMKSTTIPVLGDSGNIIGLLCINFYLNTPLSEFLKNFTDHTAVSENTALEGHNVDEIFSNDTRELITQAVLAVRDEVYANAKISASNKNKEIIYRLYENGTFNFKNAIAACTDILNISKNTVYLHLRAARQKSRQKS